jgi:uncharacterized membrane protein YeaQ/YmgE (transglycosylase-associated protein family)
MSFAAVDLQPGGIFMWLLMGLISGWLTGKFMDGAGYGFLHDIVLGLVGALVGGFVAGFLLEKELHFWGTVVVAFLGGCVVVGLYRKIRGNRPTV